MRIAAALLESYERQVQSVEGALKVRCFPCLSSLILYLYPLIFYLYRSLALIPYPWRRVLTLDHPGLLGHWCLNSPIKADTMPHLGSLRLSYLNDYRHSG